MKTILLVEDDYALIKSLKAALLIKNYQVLSASSCQEAKWYIQDHHIDLVILDIQLPDGNGIELCQYIRERSYIPILFLTANDSEDKLVEGFNNGGDDYMTKPFRIKELYARLNALLRRNQRIQNIITLGDYQIDISRREISKFGKDIVLSPTDFEILKTMITSQEQIFTREQLLTLIDKNGQYYVEDNTLSVHIKRLRDKLGTYHGVSYIETVRGIGYRINREVLYGNKQ